MGWGEQGRDGGAAVSRVAGRAAQRRNTRLQVLFAHAERTQAAAGPQARARPAYLLGYGG